MGAALYLHHPSSLEHDTGAHPERADRITALEGALRRRDWLGFEPTQSPTVAPETLTAVHPRAHVDRIEALSAAGGGMLDLDTVVSSGSYSAALHAAGGAVALVDALLDGSARTGISAHRPPGHHAEAARAMGFCLFNNVALAARHALANHGVERVLVLDWDVHHGNGTNDIFAEDAGVLYASIHESPLYPGTGRIDDVGRGIGEGCTLNLPVGAGSGDPVFASLVEHVVVPIARAYEPGLILVSAGYDAHRDDPLASCRVTEGGYAAMTGSMRRLADELDVPLGFVLEGGYQLAALARSAIATLEVAAASHAPPLPDLPVHPLAEDALAFRASRSLQPGASRAGRSS